MKLCIIDGHPGSGKSLIRGMLDDTDEVFCSPFHDLPHNIFDKRIRGNLDAAIEQRNSEYVRKMISLVTRYFRIEKIIRDEYFQMDVSYNRFEKFPVTASFSKIDSNIFSSIFSTDVCSTADFFLRYVSTLTTALSRNMGSQNIFATLGDGNLEVAEDVLAMNPEAYIIYVKRDTKEILYSLSARPNSFSGLPPNKRDVAKALRKNLAKGLAITVEKKSRKLSSLKQKFPERVLILDFQDIFRNQETVRKDMCNFLSIKNSEALRKFSFLGMQCKSVNPLESQLDSFENELDLKDERLLRYIDCASKRSAFNRFISLSGAIILIKSRLNHEIYKIKYNLKYYLIVRIK